jgi:2-polyprenyl-3-methyl-5-hydroxy-6-metoxy-1,4-benzoquinol methylase
MHTPAPLPDPHTLEKLFTLPAEAVKWEVLKTALELNVFNHLTGPTSAAEAASILSTHPQNTAHLLDALVALGCLSKQDGEYTNTPLATTFLKQGGKTSLADTILFMNHWDQPLLNGGMLQLVKNGPATVEEMGDEEIWKRGARASACHARAGRAQQIASYVSSLPEFPSFSKMLDLGAGPGVIGIAVTAAHPSLTCCLFDQPAVCTVADEMIAEAGMSDRVHTLRGDYMNNALGEGYDFVMANYTLNFYKDRLPELMDKIHSALNPGGVFMVSSDGLSDDKTSPPATVISWLCTSLQGKEMSFEQETIPKAMLGAGFASVQSRTWDRVGMAAHGPVDVHLARKAGRLPQSAPANSGKQEGAAS